MHVHTGKVPLIAHIESRWPTAPDDPPPPSPQSPPLRVNSRRPDGLQLEELGREVVADKAAGVMVQLFRFSPFLGLVL